MKYSAAARDGTAKEPTAPDGETRTGVCTLERDEDDRDRRDSVWHRGGSC